MGPCSTLVQYVSANLAMSFLDLDTLLTVTAYRQLSAKVK